MTISSAIALPHSYVQEFILYQQLRGRRQGTLDAYKSFLDRFFRIVHKQPTNITVQDIRQFLMSETRVSELVALNWDNIDITVKQAIIRDGKGGKSRVVPISTKAARLLKRYRATRKDDNPWIFQSRHSLRMVRETVERRISALGKKAGIQKRVTPHRLRHSLATHLLEAGMPIDMIQKVLGHASIATTQIYARTQMSGVEQYYRRVFP